MHLKDNSITSDTYLGRDEPPTNFNKFWLEKKRLVENYQPSVNLIPKKWQLEFIKCFDLYFDTLDGSNIYAKVVLPATYKKVKCPILFKFHGYQGQSADWSEAFKFTAAGIGVVMMDVRGQAGRSEDLSCHRGNTVKGHIVRGLTDGPENLFYTQVYQDVMLLIRLVASWDFVDETKLMTYGESQGGALALVGAALSEKISKTLATYPFLADFRKVLEFDHQEEAYDELHRYFKFTDPFCQTKEQIYHTLGFIDVKNFSHLIKANVTLVCGLKDTVCPPLTQYAIYNRLMTEKKLLLLPEYGHEALNVAYQDMVFSWSSDQQIK